MTVLRRERLRVAALVGGLTALAATAGGCNIYTDSLLEPTGGKGGTSGSAGSTTVATGGGGATGTTSSSTDTTSTDTTSTTSTSSTSTTTTTASTTTTTTSTTSTTPPPECTIDADCPGTTTCHPVACAAGHCVPGDAPAGDPCADGGGKVCDGAGHCVACNTDTDCGGTNLCTAHTCGPSPCHNGAKDPGETDVDCGGACVTAGGTCAQGKLCAAATDCSTAACADGVCCESACAGLCLACDLAGAVGTCAPVPEGQDPASECPGADVCNGQGACRCADGITNGAETGPDCGGGVCPACADHLACQVASDCKSGVCLGGACAVPTCADGVKNGAETGPDCGAQCPSGCPVGGGCNVGADCDSGVCLGKSCQPAVCGDGVRGGAEQCDDGNTASWDGCTSGCLHEAAHLLISEVKFGLPDAAEFVEIYNPTSAAVDLGSYYLADYNTYYMLTLGLGAPSSTDFRIQFPAGAQIAPHAFAVVSLHLTSDFQATFPSVTPDFDLGAGGAPTMLGVWGSSVSLTNTSEMLVLFRWNGTSPHVEDVDYVTWGTDTTVRVDKTGVSMGGVVYAADTAAGAQLPASSPTYYDLHRCDTAETSETGAAGNGITGQNETSESGTVAWRSVSLAAPPTPKGPPPAGLCP